MFLDTLLARSLPLLPKKLVGVFAAPYVAGERAADALDVTRDLMRAGLATTIDVLGEHIREPREAEEAARQYRELLAAIQERSQDANVSLKLTQLGLKLDRKLATDNLRSVVARAAELGNFVRIDMEDSSCTEQTLDIYAELRQEFSNLGVVLQACLKRTLGDAQALARSRANVRLCKGIYREPEAIAYVDRERIRESFLSCLDALFAGGAYVGIATHDEVIVERAEQRIRELGLPARGAYEFQMLLGVRNWLRDELVGRGHRVRIYVPFGADWYAYSLRRLRENPAIAGYVAKAVLLGDSRGGRR